MNADFNSEVFHQKIINRDGSALLTGSTNFTAGVTQNLNHVVIVRDRKVANTDVREFREIRQGHFGKLNEGHDEKTRDVTVLERARWKGLMSKRMRQMFTAENFIS